MATAIINTQVDAINTTLAKLNTDLASIKPSISAVTDGMKQIAKRAAKHYTFRWDKVNAKGIRLNDAADITTTTTNFGHFGSVNANYDNPFDSIYPWNGRKLCNIDIDLYMGLSSGDSIRDCVTAWEGDANFSYEDQYGVWVYTPEFWGSTWDDGTYRYFDVSDLYGDNHYPEMITGRYLGCDAILTINGTSKHCFLPKVGIPLTNVSVATMHTYANNYRATLTDIYTLDASTLLFVVEYATMNCQAALGNGCSDLYQQWLHPSSNVSSSNEIPFATANAKFVVGAIIDIGTSVGGNQIARTYITAVSGSTITVADTVTCTTANHISIHGCVNVAAEDIGSASGYIGTDGRCDAFYRGEVLWGNKWRYALGAYRQTDTGAIWVCGEGVDPDSYNALNTSVHTNTGLVLPASSNYIQTLGMADGFSIAPFCTAVGGNATNPVGDYCYVPALTSGNTILLVGGAADSGANAGLFCGYWGDGSGYSSWRGSASPHLKNPS